MDWGWCQGIKSHHTHRHVNEFGYSCHQRHLTWAKVRRTGLLPSGPKSSFQMREDLYFIWKPRRKGGAVHSPSCLKSSVKFPQSVMIWGAMSSAGVGPLCFLKTKVSAPVYQVNPAGFGTCPLCQKHQKLVKWPWCWCAWLASKLTRPEPHRESMGYCQEENEKQETKKCRWAEGHCQRNLGFCTTSAVPQTDHLHATRIEAVIKAKGALPSIEYIYSKWTYFPEGQQFTKNIFFSWFYEVF